MKRPDYRWLSLAALALGTIVGCAQVEKGLIAPGEDAPEIVAGRWVGGEQPTLEGKIVVVDVFATWCEPCARATPKLVEIYDEFHPHGVEFVALTGQASNEVDDVIHYCKELKVPWVVGMDAMPTIDKLGVSYIPMVVVIGPDGNVISVGDDEPRLRSTLAKAVAKTST